MYVPDADKIDYSSASKSTKALPELMTSIVEGKYNRFHYKTLQFPILFS